MVGRRYAVAIVAMLGAMALLLMPSGAAAKSRVTIMLVDSDPVVFAGQVKSDRAACRNRNVRLFYTMGGEDFFTKSDRSNRKGDWRVNLDGQLIPIDADWFVRVTKRPAPNGDCARLRSRNAPVNFSPRVPRDQIDTSVTILASQIDPDLERPARIDFNGRVQAAAPCKKNRVVNVYKLRPGRDTKIATGKSNRKGKWYAPGEVAGQNSNGTYYAKAPSVKRGGDVCRADRSANHVADQQQARLGGPVVYDASVKITRKSIKRSARGPKRVIRGKVSSRQARCRKGSTVEVYVQDGTAQPRKIGQDKTNSKGEWKVSKLVSRSRGDRAYAYLVPKRLGDSARCTGGRSNTVTLR